MRHFVEPVVIVAIFSSLALLSVVAQDKSASSNLVSHAHMVLVPVVVTYKQSNPVDGLAR